MKMTAHLNKRRKRVGLNKKGYTNFISKAFERGLRYDDIQSKPTLYHYIRSIMHEDCYPIIYNQYVLIVSNNKDVGITILTLPTEYYKIAQQIKNAKEKKKNDKRRSNRTSPEAEDNWQLSSTYDCV